MFKDETLKQKTKSQRTHKKDDDDLLFDCKINDQKMFIMFPHYSHLLHH